MNNSINKSKIYFITEHLFFKIHHVALKIHRLTKQSGT